MPEFYVEQRQSGKQLWVVEAGSREEAIRIVQAGDGDPVDYSIDRWGAYSAKKSQPSEPVSKPRE